MDGNLFDSLGPPVSLATGTLALLGQHDLHLSGVPTCRPTVLDSVPVVPSCKYLHSNHSAGNESGWDDDHSLDVLPAISGDWSFNVARHDLACMGPGENDIAAKVSSAPAGPVSGLANWNFMPQQHAFDWPAPLHGAGGPPNCLEAAIAQPTDVFPDPSSDPPLLTAPRQPMTFCDLLDHSPFTTEHIHPWPWTRSPPAPIEAPPQRHISATSVVLPLNDDLLESELLAEIEAAPWPLFNASSLPGFATGWSIASSGAVAPLAPSRILSSAPSTPNLSAGGSEHPCLERPMPPPPEPCLQLRQEVQPLVAQLSPEVSRMTQDGGNRQPKCGRRAGGGVDGGASSDQRRSGGRGGSHGRVTLDALRGMFEMPVQEVVRALGISATDLKRRCRALGIHRWPQRKLLSLRRLTEAVEGDKDLTPEQREQMLERVAHNRSKILADPDVELEPGLKPLRQVHYKRNFIDRQGSGLN